MIFCETVPRLGEWSDFKKNIYNFLLRKKYSTVFILISQLRKFPKERVAQKEHMGAQFYIFLFCSHNRGNSQKAEQLNTEQVYPLMSDFIQNLQYLLL